MRAPAVSLAAVRPTIQRAVLTALAVAATAGFVWLALKDLEPNPFHPHGYCYFWEPSIVGLLVASDLSIWLSYSAIAVTLAWVVLRSHHGIPFQWVFLAFGGFIVACGLTHLMDVVTLWKAAFWLAADIKLVTAVSSVATAVVLPPLVPKVLGLVKSARLSDQHKGDLEQAVSLATAGEQRFRTLFDSSPDGMLAVGTDGRIEAVNSTAEALFGYSRRELLGQKVEILLPDHVRDRHVTHREVFNENPRMRPMGAGLDLEGQRKDGTRFPVEISLSPLTSIAGETGVLAVIRDITERKKAEEQQALLEREKDARAEAEAASQAKDELLSVVSHELRTPLNAILGWTVMLRSGRLTPEATARALAVIERNAQVQRQVVDDLLDVSRIVAGKMTLDSARLDLRAVVDTALDSIRPPAEAKGVALGMNSDPDVPAVIGDAIRLQQVFWNLLSNAVKFTPSGGRVQVSISAAHGQVRVEVTDNGIGIDAAFLPFVFDRFRQHDSSTTRGYGGLGLGLSLVRHLVEWHGGTVVARSAGPGRGARFTVALPAAQGEAEERPERVAERVAGTVALTGVRVLIAEDDGDSQDLLRVMLSGAGALVTAVSSGREALERLAAGPHDVLVADISMPDLDGYELIRLARERGLTIPAVAVTAHGRDEDAARARAAGFDLILVKPASPDDVLVAVAGLAHRP